MTTVSDYASSLPDFTGVPQSTKVIKATGTTTTIQTNLTYDQSYRLTAVDQYYNGSSTVNHVAAYLYSEAGQLVQKSLAYNTGTSTWLQNPCYRYNIRGQVVTINNSKLTADGGQTCTDSNPVFGMDLYYNTNDPNLTSTTPYYDGKLSSVKWMAMNASNTRGNERAFVYSYDGVNRYTGEAYSERATAGTGAFTLTHGWDETGIAYDANGNITALKRDSSVQNFGAVTLIDNLSYTYSTTMPDQLLSVSDATSNVQGFPYKASGTYTYDANGNLTADPYQGITHVSYDVLNKTDTTVITSGSTYITYTYDAGGNLLRKKAYNSGVLTQTDYIDGFVYTGTGTQTLSYAPMPEGRLLTTSLTQEYVITDPQGNARVSFQNNSGVAKVTQENSYYGYGLQMPGSLVGFSSPPNKHMYNVGSEWQNDTKSVNAGVPDYYQTFYRNYDPTLGRFIAVDPMAEGSESMGVYHYAGDNPIMGNDPGGNMLANPNAEKYADLDKEEQGAFMGSDLGGGGGGSIYTNPADAIGRNSDPNWMNDGQFDDVGSGIDPKTGKSYGSEGGLSFSSDEGAAGRAFWLPAERSGGALDASSGNIVTITNPDAIAAIQEGLSKGNDVTYTVSGSGFWQVGYNNAMTDQSGSDLTGSAALVAFGKVDNQGGDPFSSKSSDNNSTLQNLIGPSLGSNHVHPFVVSFLDPYVVLQNNYGFKRVVAVTKPVGTILPSQWIDDNGLTVKATLFNIFWEQYPRLGGTTATGVLGYSVNLQYSNGLSFHLDEFVTISYP